MRPLPVGRHPGSPRSVRPRLAFAYGRLFEVPEPRSCSSSLSMHGLPRDEALTRSARHWVAEVGQDVVALCRLSQIASGLRASPPHDSNCVACHLRNTPSRKIANRSVLPLKSLSRGARPAKRSSMNALDGDR